VGPSVSSKPLRRRGRHDRRACPRCQHRHRLSRHHHHGWIRYHRAALGVGGAANSGAIFTAEGWPSGRRRWSWKPNSAISEICDFSPKLRTSREIPPFDRSASFGVLIVLFW